ncbi:MAG: hypothetical protein COA99_02595 [Moraxellaceae bacterium]|nr:MAG: hypothetical protein COA99_02595 [Moraxellaceae bacterium]
MKCRIMCFYILLLALVPILLVADPIFQTQLYQDNDDSFIKFGSSVAIFDEFVVVGAPGQAGEYGQTCIYKRLDQSWHSDFCLSVVSAFYLEPGQFGRFVSISEEYAIVSSLQQGAGRMGVVYIFKHQNGIWDQQAELIKSDPATDDTFSGAVGISGDYAAVGSPALGASHEGAVYIYQNTDSGWVSNVKISSISLIKSHKFGTTVGMFGDYLIIGDPEHGRSREGAVYIYKREDETWNLQASLKGGAVTKGGDFGSAIAITDEYAVVGAKSENDPDVKKNKKVGAVYVYKREGKLWHHQAKLVSSDASMGDNFGSSVSIYGDYIVIGAERNESSTGSAYLYKNIAGLWTEVFKFEAEDGEKQDSFGHAVSIYEEYLVAGAHNKNGGENQSGEVYVYYLNPNTDKTQREVELSIAFASINTSENTTDSDADGISDIDEVSVFGTDPNNADSDNDGLSDKEEIFVYQSDPLSADTDNDGLLDLDEVILYNSDPTLSDSDNDGFSDFDEVTYNKTDPSLIDSDGDGFTDQEEITDINTNPSLADTDGDGITDNEEINIFKTDPYLTDSDGDGFSDGNEVTYYETDPLDQADSPGSPTVSNSYTPAEGQVGTMAFEDQWPLKGDYDFNDAVFNYNVEETKQDGLIKQIVLKLLPVARGAVHDNSLELLINTPISNISFSSITSKGNTVTLNPIADGNKTLFSVIKSIKDAIPPPPGFKMSNTLSGSPKVNGQLYTVTIAFNSPVAPSILGAPPYNSFISRTLANGEVLEVHFPGHFPSKKASRRQFGQFDDDSDVTQDRYYQTEDNLPWAMLIPSVWHHTKERVDLSNGYPDILNWASSRGKKNKTWYKSKRRGKFVFEDVTDI